MSVCSIDYQINPSPSALAGTGGAYPLHLEGTVLLQDGRRIAIRPIRPDDAGALQTLVARSHAQDVRFRFLHTMKHLPDRLAARLSQIDYAREMAFVAIDPDDPAAIIGVARLISDSDGMQAEYSILLRRDHQGEGLGYALMKCLIDFARSRGIVLVYGDVLNENEPMLSMCADLGFRRSPHGADPSVQRVVLHVKAKAD